MPITLTYPGVYIEEIPSGVHPIAGVATSITAFIGRARRGPSNLPVRIQSLTEFERVFGGLWELSTLGYAVHHYFLNGGTDALIVRVHQGATKATLELPAADGKLILEAASEGAWGKNLQATVDHETADPNDDKQFNLRIDELNPATSKPVAIETFRNLSLDEHAPRFITKVLEQESTLVRVVENGLPSSRPNKTDKGKEEKATGGGDGSSPTDSEYKDGISALDQADLFNLLCIPPFEREKDVSVDTWNEARAYCKDRHALLIVDAPSGWTHSSDPTGDKGLSTMSDLVDENAALYFPRLRMADPLQENRLEEFAPCGAVAGVIARTDAQRGIWKAPAGLDARLRGVRELTVKLTNSEQGALNPLGINCLRTFPESGHVVWGARTLQGADRLASEWKYLPVRRLALYLEESLYRGTQWVVFEPNAEPLWSQIRLNVGAFLHDLFRQGAFQGSSPREAYLVKCDRETTTQADIDQGIVNIVVGFAPLKPAEFVVIKIQQLAGQIQT